MDADYKELENQIQQLRRFIDEDLATIRDNIDTLQKQVAQLEKKCGS